MSLRLTALRGSIRARLACLALAALCGALALAPAGAAAKAACPRYELIGARGSGQRSLPQQQRMGAEVFDLFKRLGLALPGAELRGYGVQYSAVSVWPTVAGAAAFLHFGGAYTSSVREGADDAMLAFTSFHKRCPGARFILAGYSQGAQVMGDVLQRRMSAAQRALVAAVALFGDPYFRADSFSARTGDPSRFGIFGARPEWAPDLAGKAFSYCHARDPICGMTTRDVVGGVTLYVRHFDFDTHQHLTPAYVAEGDTAAAAAEIAQALGREQPATAYRGPLDVAFVIDSTGSMSDEIDAVKDNVNQLVGQIGTIDPDFRVALVDYKDEPAQDSAYQARLDVGFTTDLAAFSAAVDGLAADGGGDAPESVYAGIMTALGLDWRTGAKKLVVQIGDAPAKDPEPITGYTLDSVRQRALAVDPAVVDTVETGTDEDAQSSLSAIAGATAGTYLQLPDATDDGGLVPAIDTTIQQSTVAPSAALHLPSSALAGVPAAFSAAGSSGNGDAIAGYDWDFDGDGTYDLTTTAPVASHVYPGAFAGTVSVRVRARAGLAAIATGTIGVAAQASAPPPRPRGLTATGGDRSVLLSWTLPADSQARWLTIRAGGRVLDRVAAAPDGTRQTWRIGGLVNGRRYAFAVRAGNERGEGPRAGPARAVPMGVDRLSAVRISPSTLRSGARAVLRYRGTAPSRTVVAIERGHVTLGRLRRRDRVGAVRVDLGGWLAAHPLPPGAYRLRITTRNRRGAGRPVLVAFRIRR